MVQSDGQGVRAQNAGGRVVAEHAFGMTAKVRANNGAAGVAGPSIERFAATADVYLSELSAALRDGTYSPQAVKRVDIPKGDGGTRPLGIPTRASYCTLLSSGSGC